MNEAEEFSVRIGDGTEFAASLTCLPIENEGGIDWKGMILFDNDAFNWEDQFPDYKGMANVRVLRSWEYPRLVASGAYMANLLMTWHADIVKLIGRVRGKE